MLYIKSPTLMVLVGYLIVYFSQKTELARISGLTQIFSGLKDVVSVVLVMTTVLAIIFYKRKWVATDTAWIYLYLCYSAVVYALKGNYSIFDMYYAFAIPIVHFVAKCYSHYLTFEKIRHIYFLMVFLVICIFLTSFMVDAGTLVYLQESTNRVRYTLGFVKPSYLGEVLVILVYMLTILRAYRVIQKNTAMVSLSFIIPALLINGSRASILSVIVFFLFYLSCKYKKKAKMAAAGILLFLVGVNAFMEVDIYPSINSDTINKYSSGRMMRWSGEVQSNVRSYSDVYIGVGHGNAIPILNYDNRNPDERAYHIDSFYVELFIQQGLIGVLMVLIYAQLIYKSTRNNLAKAVFVSMMVYGIFESIIFNLAAPMGLFPLLLVFFLDGMQRKIVRKRIATLGSQRLKC